MSNISKLKRAQNEEEYLLQHIEEYKERLKSAQDRVLKLRNMEILDMVNRADLDVDTLKKIISDYQAERLLEERRMEEEMKLVYRMTYSEWLTLTDEDIDLATGAFCACSEQPYYKDASGHDSQLEASRIPYAREYLARIKAGGLGATPQQILAAAQEVADYVYANHFVWGPTVWNPAINDSERIVTCDKFVGWVLYKIGYTDQPEDQGLAIPSNAKYWLVDYLEAHGFTKITNQTELQAGDIVITKDYAHVFILGEHVSGNVWWRYDCGTTLRIQHLGVGNPNAEVVTEFTCAYRTPGG